MDATKGSWNTVSKHTETGPSGDRVSQAIVFITSGTAALLQYKTADGGVNRVVVAIVFGDLLFTYYASLVCVMFAFSCAFSAIFLLHTKPKASRVLRVSAIMCFSLALILLFSAIFYNYFN